MGEFVQALAQAGWIRFGEPAERSRFWGLLQGPRAEMFGVFSSYELQVLHDWMRGEASADGQPWTAAGTTPARRRPTFRALERVQRQHAVASPQPVLDPDLQPWRTRFAAADSQQRFDLLVGAMAPGRHWTPAGLEATRLFWAQMAE
jgi:hypothetical protein